MAVVLAFGSACLPQNEDANEVRSSELVFDKRNVEATRGLWEWSRKVPNEADLGANLAALTRTAAVIYSKKLSGPNCDPSVISRVAGTSILTSDTRALAAFHSCRTDVRNYNLKFESYGGLMWADTAAHTSYPPSDEWTQDYRFDAVEEFPFLANRLFALGLDEWAYLQSGAQARERLRTGWWFEIEDILKGDWHHAEKSWFGQGLMPLDPAIPGKDLVLLKAKPLDPPAWGNIRSFPVTSPAVFFDQAPLAKPQNGFPGLESKLETAYTSEFVNINDLVPSACTEGIYKGIDSNLSREICLSANNTPVSHSFSGLHASTLDAAPGTSGGAVLSRNLKPVADGWSGYRYRQVFGAITAGRAQLGSVPDGWGSPVSYPDYRTAFTEIGADWVLFNRDGDNPPFPFPTFNPNDYVPYCEEYGVVTVEIDGQTVEREVCVQFVEAEYAAGTVDNSLPKPNESPKVNENPGVPTNGQYFATRCQALHVTKHPDGEIELRADPGMVYGFMGSLHRGVVNGLPGDDRLLSSGSEAVLREGGGIGSFFSICGPRSSVPYTSNWRHLNIMGNTILPQWDTLRGTISWNELRSNLVSRYEVRGVPSARTTVHRPPSFKMCPPGYAVSGFDLGKATTHYTSVVRLHCISNAQGDRSTATVELKAEGELKGYESFGRSFSLDQMIGLVDLNPSDIAEVRCNSSRPVLSGLKIRHDQYGRLNYVDPLCGVKP